MACTARACFRDFTPALGAGGRGQYLACAATRSRAPLPMSFCPRDHPPAWAREVCAAFVRAPEPLALLFLEFDLHGLDHPRLAAHRRRFPRGGGGGAAAPGQLMHHLTLVKRGATFRPLHAFAGLFSWSEFLEAPADASHGWLEGPDAALELLHAALDLALGTDAQRARDLSARVLGGGFALDASSEEAGLYASAAQQRQFGIVAARHVNAEELLHVGHALIMRMRAMGL